MRLKLTLQCVSKPAVIPINYNYQFSAAIYLLLKFGSPEFSEFLHNNGYKIENKNFKLFTFAVKLRKYQILNNNRLEGNHFELLSPFIDLYISSPLVESFIKNFVIGTFEKQKVHIVHKQYVSRFVIKHVELIPDPEITNEMNFRLLSPLVLSTLVLRNGRLSPYYLRINDPGIEENLLQNLVRKYRLIYKQDIKVDDFYFEFDKEYIEKKKGVVSKLITIAEGSKNESKIKGIMCDFKIRTNPELIKVGYECGFGSKNSMGFGFVEVNGKTYDQLKEKIFNIQNTKQLEKH
ncbi:MAG: CRISPR-associated endoribonuclease Cas6 [Ignavibacteria bacterium]|nr:CRISPR-associated endoribonuclease Cas6 [Ignavibacteria bacterium]